MKEQWIRFKKWLIHKLGGIHVSDIPVKKEIKYASANTKPIKINGVYKADPRVYEDSANYRRSVMECLEKELMAGLQETDGCIQVEIDPDPDLYTGKLVIRASMMVLPFCEVGK